MPARVSPTDRVRAKIDELFASDRELPEILEEVARLGAQLLMQAALEAEVTAFLGRDRYQRAATAPDMQPGARNGYRPVSVKTTAGPVTLERPKLRGTTAVFASRLFGKHVTKTNALESLVIVSFAGLVPVMTLATPDGSAAVVGQEGSYRRTADQVRVGQPITEADHGDRRDVRRRGQYRRPRYRALGRDEDPLRWCICTLDHRNVVAGGHLRTRPPTRVGVA